MYELQNSDANTALNFFGENKLKKLKNKKSTKNTHKINLSLALRGSYYGSNWTMQTAGWGALMGQGSYGLPEEVSVHIEDRAIVPTIAEGPWKWHAPPSCPNPIKVWSNMDNFQKIKWHPSWVMGALKYLQGLHIV